MPKIKIAIDGGAHTGVATYDTKAKQIVYAATLDFWGAFGYVASFDSSEVEIVVESLNTRAALYARTAAATAAGRDRFAASVGAVRRETELLILGLEQRGFVVRRVPPIRAKKWTAADCQRLTGYAARTSQHARDAIRLLFY